jgi:hypothetical protein
LQTLRNATPPIDSILALVHLGRASADGIFSDSRWRCRTCALENRLTFHEI